MFAIKFTRRNTKVPIIFTIIILSLFFTVIFRGIDYTSGHSVETYPTEIFSIWNQTNPTIDGSIDFVNDNASLEWDFAAIYNLYSDVNSIHGKLFLQNDNDSLYIGLDGLVLQDSTPATDWGFGIYFDIDHDGFLTSQDRALQYITNSSGSFIEFLSYSTVGSRWSTIEAGSMGILMPTTGIYAATDFTTSLYDIVNPHRQYEMKIPFIILSSGPGKNLGIGIEIFEDNIDQTTSITWPYISSDLHKVRTNFGVLGDISFGEQNKGNFEYVIEKNLNVKSTATGYNNGSYVASGDIDGNGDYELIVASNRTVVSDDNLLAIYDYVDGEYQKIWRSWTSSYQALLTFPVEDIVAYDFDQNGEDEIFVVGHSANVIRFRQWNITSDDFDFGEVIYTHAFELMGYIALGDASNDTKIDLVFGCSGGYLNVLEYDNLTGTFSQDDRAYPTKLPKINGAYPYRIHAIGLGDMDADKTTEILIQYQTTSDDILSETQLVIFNKQGLAKYADNLEDDLPLDSSITTADHYGHTAFVADVDNDLDNETIIVGKDYLRIFEQYSFTNPSPPLEIALNDGVTKPYMAGGATVADLNNDGLNELIFGANNGTLYIGTVTDTGSALEFTLAWSRDLGTSLGYHGALVVNDFDNDGENELAIGDNYGQIFIIGKGDAPQLTITNPSNDYVSSFQNILVKWTVTDDHYAVHYVEVYVKGLLTNRVGGAQNCSEISLSPANNLVEVVAFDFSGKNSTQSINVKFDVNAPQVTITSPVNYFITNQDNIDISYYNNDTENDLNHYEIYRNGILIEPSTIDETYNVLLPSSGLWNITVVAVDDTLLEGKSTIFVIRDNQAPIIHIDDPNDGDAVSSSIIDVVWSASDALSSMDYYDVYLDGDFYDTTTSKSKEVTLSTDKTYTIKVVAYDIMGNSAFHEISVIRDTVDPTVYFDPIFLSKRDDGYYYTNNPLLSLSWNATDNELGSGIYQTRITINGLLYDTYGPAITSDILNLGNDSLKEIFITAYDKAGNTANAYIGVILDRAAPNVVINNPENEFITGLDYIIVSWDSFDVGVGIKEHVILVDSIEEVTLNDPSISFYQINFLTEKKYLITVRATDLLDYSFEYSINVTYDHTAPTISIILPTSMTSYINDITTTIDWAINGLEVDYYEISINGTSFDTYTNTTYSALIALNPESYEFPGFFINVSAITLSAQVYSAFRWIYIDQIDPLVGFNTPPTRQLTENMDIHWYGVDDGSGLDYFEISLNTTTIIKDKTSTSHVFDVSELNGIYELTIVAYDLAGNSNFETVYVEIYLYAPLYVTSLGSLLVCNDLNIQFNLSVTDPGIGIDSISVIVDNTYEIFSGSYGSESIKEPFWMLINITDDQYLVGLTDHNITITITDEASRESIDTIDIILDTDAPVFWQAPILDSSRLSEITNEITLFSEGNNNHTITVYIEEIHQVENVTLTLTSEGYNETFIMIFDADSSTSTVKVYELTIDFSELEEGSYSMTFNFADEAGNSNSEIYSLNIVLEVIESSFPYIYVLIGLGVAIIIGIVVAIALRKPVSNQGWEDEIVVVAYILKSGLTALFVPYSVEIATDEQLFGGAMSGIRSILEEIIGKKKRFEVETVEFGDKHLLIYTGLYGDSIVLVRSIKPIHSRLLSKFAEEFEDGYGECLDDDQHVSAADYYGAEDVVEKFFGKRTPLDAAAYAIDRIKPDEYRRRIDDMPIETGKDALLSSFYHEILENHEAFESLSESTKVQIGDAITFAEESLTDLISRDFKDAEKKAHNALKSLQLARKSIGTIKHFQAIFNTIPKIVELVLFGVVNGQNNNTEDYHRAIELASQLFLSQVT